MKNAKYNSPQYYQQNRQPVPRQQEQQPDDRNADNYAADDYQELNTGKYETYEGGGYYGSNYGTSTPNYGRDFEQNAGYRYHYNRLPVEPQSEGGHRGKGPRSYQRGDHRILEDINDSLTAHPQIDATDIDVTISGGEVIVSGTVNDRQMKRNVEDLIEGLRGVKHLENRLRIRQQGQSIVNIRNSND